MKPNPAFERDSRKARQPLNFTLTLMGDDPCKASDE